MPFQGILRTYLTPRSWPLLYPSDRCISLPPSALEQEERLYPVPGASFPSQVLAGSSTSGQGFAEIPHSGLPVPSLVPVVISCTESRAGTFSGTFLLLKTFHLAPGSHPVPTASALLSPATTSYLPGSQTCHSFLLDLSLTRTGWHLTEALHGMGGFQHGV